MISIPEDAVVHGLTVMECEPRYRREYYEYLLKEKDEGRLNTSYFKSLTKDYKYTSKET